MRKLVVHEFMSLDGVMQAPGGKDEDRDGGFEHGGWTLPYWHDDIGATFGALMQEVDAFLLGRRTYITHAEAFEPMKEGDPFGDMMNAPAKYVVSKTLEKPTTRTNDPTKTALAGDNSKPAANGAKTNGARTYTVKKGDTLYSISKAMYGTSAKVQAIVDANKSKLKSANDLSVGMVLDIP